MRKEWLIDANLLVLLIAGLTDESLIVKHARLKRFRKEDYYRLLEVVGAPRVAREGDSVEEDTGTILLTPHALTEASNLLGQHREPERSRLFDTLRRLVKDQEEVGVASARAVRTPVFRRLGLTDGALFDVASAERPLLTVDLDLYSAVARRGHRAAINFTYLQDLDIG